MKLFTLAIFKMAKLKEQEYISFLMGHTSKGFSRIIRPIAPMESSNPIKYCIGEAFRTISFTVQEQNTVPLISLKVSTLMDLNPKGLSNGIKMKQISMFIKELSMKKDFFMVKESL